MARSWVIPISRLRWISRTNVSSCNNDKRTGLPNLWFGRPVLFATGFSSGAPPLEIHASSRTVTAVTRLSRQSLEVSHLVWRILLHQKIGAPLHALRNVRQGESRGAVLPRENGFRWKQEEGPLGGIPLLQSDRLSFARAVVGFMPQAP